MKNILNILLAAIVAMRAEAYLGDDQVFFSPSAMYLRTMMNGIDRTPEIDPVLLTKAYNELKNFDIVQYLLARNQTTASNGSVRKCIRDSLEVAMSLPKLLKAKWAWKYFDAMSKLPAGILRGTGKWYGDFDECVNIERVYLQQEGEYFDPHYCYVGLTLSAMADQPINEGVQQTFHALMFGLCLSQHCDKETILDLVNPITSMVGLKLHPNLTHCQDMNLPFTTPAYVAISVYSVFGGLLAIGLLFDVLHRLASFMKSCSSPKADKSDTEQGSADKAKKPAGVCSHFGQIILAFSPLTNYEKLVAVPKPVGEDKVPNFSAINGIRTLSLFWVMLGHFFPFHIPVFDNALDVNDRSTRLTFQFVIVAYFAVDTFLFLSGFLGYWSLYRRMSSKDFKFWLSLPLFYFHRLIRICPPFYAVILLDLGLWAYLHNGPFYFQGSDYMCANNWWANLLFIHNFYECDKECVPWSWYLAADMQMFVFLPFVVYAFVKMPVIMGWGASIAALVAQIAYGVSMTAVYNLPSSPQKPPGEFMADFGIGGGTNGTAVVMKNHFEYNRSIYVKPYSRMGPYIIGVICCHLLVRHQEGLKKLFNHWWFHFLGWPISFATLLAIVYAMYGVFRGDRVDPNWVDCIYNGVARIGWGMAIGWIVLACSFNRAGPVGNILNWNLWSLPARLSYSAYLLHPFVYLFFVQTNRRSVHLTDITIIYQYCAGVLTTMMVSTVYTLAFESPIIGLTKGA